VRKVLTIFAILTVLTVSQAMAQPAGNVQPCARQSAIWRHVFVEGSGRPSPCFGVAVRFAGGSISTVLEPEAGEPAIATSGLDVVQAQPAAPAPPPKAFEYSEAYATRRKIHFYASFATIPLFVTQYVLGEKLYDGASGGTKSAHSAAAVGIEALFGVNTVTGVWNMWESRKDPNGRAKRFIHGFLMLGADVGFVATGLLAPDEEDGRDGRGTHRTVAVTSMAVSAVSYAIMLIGR
jgi:hypothetical protein